MINNYTPIESYSIGKYHVHVKREDLCCPPPGPTFAKVRGLYKRLQNIKAQGINTVGYTETSISMAGWGVSWMAKELGMQAIIFAPVYKSPPDILKLHESKWKEHGATIIPIKANMASVNYNICKGLLKKYSDNAVLLPLGLPFQETVEEVAEEAHRSHITEYETVVVSVGSGTMCAGILRATANSFVEVHGVLCRKTTKPIKKKNKIVTAAGLVPCADYVNFHIHDLKYNYADREDEPCPFPCHPYYDRKAWKWLVDNVHTLEPPILFWNIGA